jgi:hypothetical protein
MHLPARKAYRFVAVHATTSLVTIRSDQNHLCLFYSRDVAGPKLARHGVLMALHRGGERDWTPYLIE